MANSEKNSLNDKYLGWIIITGIVLNAFFRCYSYLITDRTWPDEALYAWIAQRIIAQPSVVLTPEATSFHPPLLPAVLTLGQMFFHGIAGYRFIGMLINLLGIVGIYILGKRISNNFVGVLSALFLSFNPFYLVHSNLVLIDGPLTVAYIFLSLFLFSAAQNQINRAHIAVGTMLAVIVLLKWSGFIAIIYALIYYLTAFPNLNLKERFKQLVFPLSPPLIALFILFIFNVRPDTNAVSGQYFQQPFYYYVQNLDAFLFNPYSVPFFFIGLFFLVRRAHSQKWLFVSWIGSVLILTSLAVEKTPRYILPALPAALLICSLGIDDLLSLIRQVRFQKYLSITVFALVLMSCLHIGPRVNKFLSGIDHHYTGFAQAGDWVKAHYPDEATILAGSKRAIRYYSGVNYEEYGGKLRLPPNNKKDFEHFLKGTRNPVICVVDIWEYTQPDWLYPMTNEKMKYLINNGFQLSQIIYSGDNQKQHPSPIIWIFQK